MGGARVRGPERALVVVAPGAVVALAALLGPQREGRGAGHGAGRADHGAGPALGALLVAGPLGAHVHVGGHAVGGHAVVGARRAGDDGADVVALALAGRLLLHGGALREHSSRLGSTRRSRNDSWIGDNVEWWMERRWSWFRLISFCQ